jgi:hypothetical protein
MVKWSHTIFDSDNTIAHIPNSLVAGVSEPINTVILDEPAGRGGFTGVCCVPKLIPSSLSQPLYDAVVDERGLVRGMICLNRNTMLCENVDRAV